MRSTTYVHPGEELTCQGCHEDKWKTSPPRTQMPLALRREPSRLRPEANGGAPLVYAKDIKPILAANCAACHREKKQIPFEYSRPEQPKGAAKSPHLSDYVVWIGAGSSPSIKDSVRTPVGKFGAQASPLLKHLGPEHHGVKLNQTDRSLLTLWMDLNSQELSSHNWETPARGSPRDSVPDSVARQRRGELVWPQGMDPKDPIYGVYSFSAHFLRECERLARQEAAPEPAKPQPRAK